jgi:hypothetical protein
MQLVPNYVAKTNSTHRYQIIRSFNMGGHEVAWVEITYFLNSDREQQTPLKMYRVMCDCDFIEGIGWNLDDKGHLYTVHGRSAEDCTARPLVMAIRQQELRDHLEKAAGKPDVPSEKETVLYVVRAIEILASFAHYNVMIEAGGGAEFWGGYFYLQTVQAILDVEWPQVHQAMAVLYRMKKFDLNGMVVVPYTTPPEPVWRHFDSIDVDGYTLKRSLPAHDRMPHTWKLAVYEKGSETPVQECELQIDQPLEWGVDIDDMSQSEAKLASMLAELKNQPAQ